MRKKEFYNFIENNYIPSMYEINPEEKLKSRYRAYGFSGIDLYYEIYRGIQGYIKDGVTITDVGAFPGTFLRILQGILQNTKAELYGVGLFFALDEILKYRKLADDDPDTKSIKTEQLLSGFMNSVNINTINLNLDNCNSHNIFTNKGDLQVLYGKCDIVTCMEVIEHLHTPYSLFDLFHKLLKPGGICVLETNNIRNLWGIKKLIVEGSNLDPDLCDKYVLNKPTIKSPHIRFYSLDELNKLIEKAGFQIKKSYDFNFYLPLKYINFLKFKIVVGFHLLNVIPGYRSHILVMAQKNR